MRSIIHHSSLLQAIHSVIDMTEKDVAGAIVQLPLSFEIETIGARKWWHWFGLAKLIKHRVRYAIYPPTLGKMNLLSVLYLDLGFDEKALEAEPMREVMRLVAKDIDKVAEMMSVATFDGKVALMDREAIKKRAELFKWSCKPDDFVRIVLMIITQSDYVNFANSIRLLDQLRINRATSLVEQSAESRLGVD